MNVTLIQAPDHPVELIAKIASICYDSEPKNPEKLVKKLYENGHHSVFEHVWFTFLIEGISRACSHQLVRHRMAAITQRSQRYCDEGMFEYVIPDSITEDSTVAWKYNDGIEKANDIYNALIEKYEIPKEDARYILPNACTTSLYFSCNLRELIHIANERLCSRAQWEIRQVVREMVKLVDTDIRWMLKPKCLSGFLICNSPCASFADNLIEEDKDENH